MTKLRLWFAGTPTFAAHSLSALIQHPDYLIEGVFTQPDRPAGRGRKPKASAVKEVAKAHHIPVAQPQRLSPEAIPFAGQEPVDLCIVAAYGLLLPAWFLEMPRLGCINIHASLLPRWRGAAPIQRAIAAGDTQTGISIMQMDAGLDTGAVWLEKHCPISETDTAASLTDTLTQLGAEALLAALPVIASANTEPQPQTSEGATYAHKLNKAEAQLDWHLGAETLARQIRAFNPVPVAHTMLDEQPLRIFTATAHPKPVSHPPGMIFRHDDSGLWVQTGDGALCIDQLQLPGKKAASAAALANGRNLKGRQLT